MAFLPQSQISWSNGHNFNLYLLKINKTTIWYYGFSKMSFIFMFSPWQCNFCLFYLFIYLLIYLFIHLFIYLFIWKERNFTLPNKILWNSLLDHEPMKRTLSLTVRNPLVIMELILSKTTLIKSYKIFIKWISNRF